MKRKRGVAFLLGALVLAGLCWLICSDGDKRGDRVLFLSSPNFYLAGVFQEGRVMELARTSLASRWVANLVFKPLAEYPYDETGPSSGDAEDRPYPVLLEVQNDTFDNGIHRLEVDLRVEGLTSRKIQEALDRARAYVEHALERTRQTPQIGVGVNLPDIEFTGVRSPSTAYTLLTIARPARRTEQGGQYVGWGPYVPTGQVVSGLNELTLRKREGDTYAQRFPRELAFQVAPSLTKPEELDPERDLLAVFPGPPAPKDPPGFRHVMIPYGYTYVAVILRDTLDPRRVYAWIRSLAWRFVRARGGDRNRIENFWIPRGWLSLGRCDRIRQGIRGFAYPSFQRPDLSRPLPFSVGVFIGTGPWVAPIAFQDFRESFFTGVQGDIQAVDDPMNPDVDVLIYKATFDPFLDSPAVLYEFGAGLISNEDLRRLNEFSRYMLDAGPGSLVTTTLATNIQREWSENLRIFPIFSEPITIYVNEEKIEDLHMNYREGFAHLNRWRWKTP